MTFSPALSAVNLSPPPAPTPPGDQKPGATDDPGKNFLTLLVTQLQHQNPLEPMESSDLLNQLAAMTSVAELRGIHSQMTSLNEQFATGRIASATALIGHQLAIDARTFSLQGDSTQLSLSFPAPGEGRGLDFQLYDDTGALVSESHYQGSVGEHHGGRLTIPLNQLFGPLPRGSYWLESGMGDDGEMLPVYLLSKVQGVSVPSAGQEPRLTLEATVPVTLSMVRHIAP